MIREFSACLQQLPHMLAYIEEQMAPVGFERIETSKTLLGAEEALVNIIYYGYPGGCGTIEIECQRCDPPGIALIIKDRGVPYNPFSHLKIHQFNPNASLEERRIGGIGVFIMLHVMDCISYERKEGKNVLSLTKFVARH